MLKISSTKFHSITKREIGRASRGPKERALLMKKVIVDELTALANRSCLHIPLHGAGLAYGPLNEVGKNKSIFSFAKNILDGNLRIAKEKLWWAGIRCDDPGAQSALQDHYINMVGSIMIIAFLQFQKMVGSGQPTLLEMTLSKFRDASGYMARIPSPERAGVTRIHIMEVTNETLPFNLYHALQFQGYKVRVYSLDLSRRLINQRDFLSGYSRAVLMREVNNKALVIGPGGKLLDKVAQKGAKIFRVSGGSPEENLFKAFLNIQAR